MCTPKIYISVCLSLIIGFYTIGHAADPVKILQTVEDVLNAPADREATIKMQLIDNKENTKNRELTIFQKGPEKRLIRFNAPADVKGVGFLVLEDDLMYLYMPAFAKIRRIASHVKNENFMGTDFTYDDMAQNDYVKNYTPVLREETDQHYILELTPKPESEIDYSKLVMWANKQTMLPDKVEFYDRSDRLLKIMNQTDTEKLDGYWTPKHIEMENVQDEHKTIMEMTDIKHDQGIPDKKFTQRYLKRR
ncbi:MAG: outer membrane lipoprotein-sorting protein [candidate division Zixibacteria bacterium]|nr:outer membrane lipoprotein-sorting protein [candidate division Zixibacteria bacterium]